MEGTKIFSLVFCMYCLSAMMMIQAEDPYIFFEWHVTYGTQSPLGRPQQVILINGEFPGPLINSTTNNNIVVNIFNKLDEPFLIHWNGVQQRKNSWQEGLLGTNCPIPPGTNYTYRFQVKDQIGSYFYYSSTALHRAAGGYGALRIHSRDLIPVPFDTPADDFSVLVGDWYSKSHATLRKLLDNGDRTLGRPDGVLINAKGGLANSDQDVPPLAVMEVGKTYRYRICNVGMKNSINVRFQGHSMKLVEIEGSHTVQNIYDSLDVHLGQCYSVLVTADKHEKDYFFVASTRFTKKSLTSTAIVRYQNGQEPAAPELPPAPEGVPWSINQFRSFRWNLTASAARPNPQGSYHYGQINITRTIRLAGATGTADGKLRFSINGVSHVDPPTPVKLAEFFGVGPKVFQYGAIQDQTIATSAEGDARMTTAPNVVNATFRNFVEIIIENPEKHINSWHLSGYSFFAVAIEPGKWSPVKRKNYNLVDAVSRHTIQVYPKSWAAIMLTMDNAGMWNLRSVILEKQYLGQQLYFSVLSPEKSVRDEYSLPVDALLCGIVKGLPRPPPTGLD